MFRSVVRPKQLCTSMASCLSPEATTKPYACSATVGIFLRRCHSGWIDEIERSSLTSYISSTFCIICLRWGARTAAVLLHTCVGKWVPSPIVLCCVVCVFFFSMTQTANVVTYAKAVSCNVGYSDRLSSISDRATNPQTALYFAFGTSIGDQPLGHQSQPNFFRGTPLCFEPEHTKCVGSMGSMCRNISVVEGSEIHYFFRSQF